MTPRYKSLHGLQYRRYIDDEKSGKISGENVSGNPEGFVHGSYRHLMFDPKWKERRLMILDKDNHKCVNCNSQEKLHVHHRQYHFVTAIQQFKSPWDYPDYLMITLCETCHKKGHNLYKVPIVNI